MVPDTTTLTALITHPPPRIVPTITASTMSNADSILPQQEAQLVEAATSMTNADPILPPQEAQLVPEPETRTVVEEDEVDEPSEPAGKVVQSGEKAGVLLADAHLNTGRPLESSIGGETTCIICLRAPQDSRGGALWPSQYLH